MRLIEDYPACICRAHLGLGSCIHMAVLIHMPEDINKLLAELVEKKIEYQVQAVLCAANIVIQLRGYITTRHKPITGTV